MPSPFLSASPLRRSRAFLSIALAAASMAAGCGPREPSPAGTLPREQAPASTTAPTASVSSTTPASMAVPASPASTAVSVPDARQVFPAYRTDSAASSVGDGSSTGRAATSEGTPVAASAPMENASGVKP